MLVLAAAAIFIAPMPGVCQTGATAALARARKKYVGAHIKIKGPLESSSPGLPPTYINWRIAKKGPKGRYFAVTPLMESRLTFGYEKRVATVIAVQISDVRQKAPWVDLPGGKRSASEPGTRLNFVVKYDDGTIALCTCSFAAVDGNFTVVSPARPALR